MAKPEQPKPTPKPFTATSVIPDGDGWALVVSTITGDKAVSVKKHGPDLRAVCMAKAMQALGGQ